MTPPDPHVFGRFLTLADIAEVLNISASQAYALVRSGELPAIKIGGNGHWRIEREVLESYIAAKYEENRRLNLWHQSEFADLPEFFAPPARAGRLEPHQQHLAQRHDPDPRHRRLPSSARRARARPGRGGHVRRGRSCRAAGWRR